MQPALGSTPPFFPQSSKVQQVQCPTLCPIFPTNKGSGLGGAGEGGRGTRGKAGPQALGGRARPRPGRCGYRPDGWPAALLFGTGPGAWHHGRSASQCRSPWPAGQVSHHWAHHEASSSSRAVSPEHSPGAPPLQDQNVSCRQQKREDPVL